jgi:type II secretory pathway component PulF
MNKKKHWEKIDKDIEDIMTRMHPAVLIPGVLVGLIVIAGCIFKGYMGW